MAAFALCILCSSQYAWRGSEMSMGDGVLDSGKASDLSVCSWPVEPIQWTPFPLLQQLASHRSPKVSVWLCLRQFRWFRCVSGFIMWSCYCSSVKPGEGVKAAVLLWRHGAGRPGEELDCLTRINKNLICSDTGIYRSLLHCKAPMLLFG